MKSHHSRVIIPHSGQRHAVLGPSRKASRGVSVVEFSFVAPVLFIMIFAIMEFSRILMVQNTVSDAARHAARHASLAATQSASVVESSLRARVADSVPTGTEMTVTVTPSNLTTLKSGDEVSVRVSLNHGDASWVPANLFRISGTARISAESRMERE